MKSYTLIIILIVLASAVSCFHAATPDDDLLSGILLGDIAAVQQALDHGANVNRVYKDGMTPLIYSCKEYKKYHGEAGAEVTVKIKADFDKSQAKVSAQAKNVHASHSTQTVKENRKLVELLIARGADVNAKDNSGQTALSLAVGNNMTEITGILRKAGAKE